jgi:hypothetical protein
LNPEPGTDHLKFKEYDRTFLVKTKTQASNSLEIILNLNLQYQKVTEKAKGYEFEKALP